MFGRLRPSRPSPALVISLLSLFVALGGTSAYAINEWNGSNIQDDTIASADLKDGDVRNVDLKPEAVGTTRLKNEDVRSGDIKDGDLAPQDLDLLGKDVITTEEGLAPSGPTDLPTVGPSVTVNVPSSGMVALRAEVEMKSDSGAGTAAVHLTCGSGAFQVLGNTGTTYKVKGTVPGSTTGADVGVPSIGLSGWVLLDVAPGVATCRLVYSGSTGTAAFKNRKLWVMAVD
jgi:hypothetical protein